VSPVSVKVAESVFGEASVTSQRPNASVAPTLKFVNPVSRASCASRPESVRLPSLNQDLFDSPGTSPDSTAGQEYGWPPAASAAIAPQPQPLLSVQTISELSRRFASASAYADLNALIG
jgi:hypothetical protein